MVSELKGVVPPTIPDIPIVPVPVKVSACAPLIVLVNDTFDPLATTVPVKLTAPVIVMGLGVDEVKLPPKLIVVAV